MLVNSVLKRWRRDVSLGLDMFLIILFWIRSGPVALLFDLGMTLSSSSGVKAPFRGSVVRDRILFLIASSKCLLSAMFLGCKLLNLSRKRSAFSWGVRKVWPQDLRA